MKVALSKLWIAKEANELRNSGLSYRRITAVLAAKYGVTESYKTIFNYQKAYNNYLQQQ